jgi:microsomal epoxide hydrolase
MCRKSSSMIWHAAWMPFAWPRADVAEHGWEAGLPSGYARELVDHWRRRYHWPAQEARLNSYPQFTTAIFDHQVLVLHLRSPEADSLPLLLTHGWPGSTVEFLDVIGPPTDPPSTAATPATRSMS